MARVQKLNVAKQRLNLNVLTMLTFISLSTNRVIGSTSFVSDKMTATHAPVDNNNEHKLEKTDKELIKQKFIGTDFGYKHQIVWPNAIGFVVLHILALWGLFILLTGGVGIKTVIWTVLVALFAAEGITMGAHRLFTHRCFTASPLLRFILLMAQTVAGQNCMFIWCRDHRLHHRYSDTDADPHNSKRGFFFSHIGWLMMKKHPYVTEYGRKIDLSDLQADWMVMWQKKYYYPLYISLALFIPIWIPVQFFGESWLNSFLVCYMYRYVGSLNATWLVNSAAHLYGTRPYDKTLQPVESWFVSLMTVGEGWHNYHHAFPWDYKAAELPYHINPTTACIKFCEKIGLAWDLKTASTDMVTNRILRSGDGSHFKLGTEEGKASVTAVGPLHPLNPSYNSTMDPPAAILKHIGLPLFHENDDFGGNKIRKRDAATA